MVTALSTTYKVGSEERPFFPEFVSLADEKQVTVASSVLAKKQEKVFTEIAKIEAEISAAIAGL